MRGWHYPWNLEFWYMPLCFLIKFNGEKLKDILYQELWGMYIAYNLVKTPPRNPYKPYLRR